MSKFNLTLDASQIHTYLTCPLKWFYQYYENLQLPAVTAALSAPDQGTLIHNLLDLYYNYRVNFPNDDKFAQANAVIEFFKKSKTTSSLFPNDDGSLEDFLCRRFFLYVNRYAINDYNVVKNGVELGFSKLLFENNKVRFIVEGRIDLIVRLFDGNEYQNCFVDHKTQGQTKDLYPYKIQFKTYAWATGFKYGQVNYIGMQADKNSDLLKTNKLFRRNLITFSEPMIHEWENKLFDVFNEIYGILRFEKPERFFYQNKNESACGGAFESHPCQFTLLCEEYNWDIKQYLKTSKYSKIEPWSPWHPDTTLNLKDKLDDTSIIGVG